MTLNQKLDIALKFLCESKEEGYVWLYQNGVLGHNNTFGEYLPRHLQANGVPASEIIEVILHFKQRGFIHEHENGQIKILISAREFWNNGHGGFVNEGVVLNRTASRNNWTWGIAIATFVIVIITLILDVCGLFNTCN